MCYQCNCSDAKKNQSKRFIIITIDFCTRWPLAIATSSHNGNYIKRFISQEFKAKFSYLKISITNCGREFISKDTQAYLKSNNIEYITITSYHTQVNSCMKCLNGVLLNALQKLSSENPQL